MNTRNKIGFISEISAQPHIGGGVTLNKILGGNFAKIDWFCKTIHFPSEKPVFYERATTFCFPYWGFEQKLRKFLGCRLAYYFAHGEMSQNFHRKFVTKSVEAALGNELSETKILTSPNSRHAFSVIDALWRKYRFNYVTWIMDDHMIKWKSGEWVYDTQDFKLLQTHLLNARVVYVISEVMGQFYKKIFGVESHVLFSPCEMVPKPAVLNQEQGSPYRLVYFGSVGRWQNDALEFLLPSLNSGLAEIDIYTRSPELLPEFFRALPTCRICEPVPPNLITQKSSEYDAMLLPVSFKDELKNMSYFNVATKFSDCIGAQIPTIIIGPEDSIMVKHAREYGAFFVIDANDPSKIEDALAKTRDPVQQTKLYGGRVRANLNLCSKSIMDDRWKIAADWLFE